MKINYLKYSDERNKRFSIKTEITEDGKEKSVYKEAIFPEGQGHIDRMLEIQKKLQEYYTETEVCRAWKDGHGVRFEFVEGEMLLDRYKAAAAQRNISLYEQLLIYHKKIICGNEKNECLFEENTGFTEWFGQMKGYENAAGLKCANFDAIASNVIVRNGVPVFIDYEWVMDFSMPKDLAIYHCIKDGYIHNPELEEFYPLQKVLDFLDIRTDAELMEKSYRHFYEYVISDENGKSYAKDKYCCLKPVQQVSVIEEEWGKCADEWKKAVAANKELDASLRYANEEWKKCADEWKKSVDINKECTKGWQDAVAANKELDAKLKYANEEWKKCADEWKKSVDIVSQLNEELECFRAKYDEIASSRVWRTANKVKSIFH